MHRGAENFPPNAWRIGTQNAHTEADLLKLIWKHIRERLATVSRKRETSRSDTAKIALHRPLESRAMRDCRLIRCREQGIVDIGALYRSTDEATPWIPVKDITHAQNELGMVCQHLSTFEFEFEFRGRGSKCGRKTN